MLCVLLAGAGASAAPLDVTIKGQVKDQVQIERVFPEPEVALKDVIPFSRLGQTDWILSEELDYVDSAKQVAMMDVNSPKTYKPSMIEFPKPPFFVQAYPPAPEPIVVDRSPNAGPLPGENETWSFIVIDQDNQVLRKIEGNTVPTDPVQWDGMEGDKFLLKTDQVYSSMLVIKESDDKTRTIVGDPIMLPALRYIEGTSIIFEFSNRRVYEPGSPSISPVLKVLVNQLLNELKRYQGSPFEMTVFDKNLDLAQKRVGAWRKLLAENLLEPEDAFQIKVSFPGDRGEVTQVVVRIMQ